MRNVLAFAAISIVACMTAATAQTTWQEYTYPDQKFAVSFPSQPNVETKPFKAADGTTVTETIYSVRQETGLFRLAVVDLTGVAIERTTAIDQAIASLRDKGDVKMDIAARVQGNIGRYINIAGNDGSHEIAAVFYGAGRLYEIEGIVPAGNPDALSGEMIRFQQSLRFMGDAGGRRGFGPGFAPGQFQGRGQFQGQGRRLRQRPPQDPPNQPL